MVVIVPKGHRCSVLKNNSFNEFLFNSMIFVEDAKVPIVGRREDKGYWLGMYNGFTVVFTDKEMKELEQEL